MTDESANPGFYDADSSTYDEQRWTSPGGAHTNRVQQTILKSLCADWRDHRVLEIGPGTARFTVPLAKQGNRMTLVDISTGMLEQAQSVIEKAGQGEQIEAYVNGSIYELPFEDNSFDHAICLNVFNHLEDIGTALKQMARVIRPGSTLLFNYANLQSYYWPMARRINSAGTAVGQKVFSAWERPGQVRTIIADAGLELDRRSGHVHVPRAMEKFHLTPVVRVVDAISRSGPLQGLAPVHFCRCRKRSEGD